MVKRIKKGYYKVGESSRGKWSDLIPNPFLVTTKGRSLMIGLAMLQVVVRVNTGFLKMGKPYGLRDTETPLWMEVVF